LVKAGIDEVIVEAKIAGKVGQTTMQTTSGETFILLKDTNAPQTPSFEPLRPYGRSRESQKLRLWPIAREPRAPICDLCGCMPRLCFRVNAESDEHGETHHYVCQQERRHVFRLQPGGGFARESESKSARTRRALEFAAR
jgi:hypothetical protein